MSGKAPPAWDQLSSWAAVVACGSISGAARRQVLSRAGVSQHVRQLEQRLGCELPDRSTRPALPTAGGRRRYGHALELLQRAREMVESVRQITRMPRSVVRLGGVDSFAATAGPQRVRGLFSRVRRRHWLSGLTPDLLQRFDERHLDLLIGTQTIADREGIDSLGDALHQWRRRSCTHRGSRLA